ncbi:hypothetical protein AA18889_2639 [Acetobacter senegalensis DSM 18889]|nr:hypothetical protein AA18889_2639 [Acetobacter senegalensis DSM 18889]
MSIYRFKVDYKEPRDIAEGQAQTSERLDKIASGCATNLGGLIAGTYSSDANVIIADTVVSRLQVLAAIKRFINEDGLNVKVIDED